LESNQRETEQRSKGTRETLFNNGPGEITCRNPVQTLTGRSGKRGRTGTKKKPIVSTRKKSHPTFHFTFEGERPLSKESKGRNDRETLTRVHAARGEKEVRANSSTRYLNRTHIE